jgi:hypothetical protein
MRGGPRSWALAAAATFAALCPTPAHADVASAEPPESRGYVELTVQGPDDQAASLGATLRELLARLGLDLHIVGASALATGSGVAQAAGLLRARVSVDETPADRVDIVVTALVRGQPAPPVTRTLSRADSAAILTEQVAHVVHATLESLLATEDAPPVPSPAASAASTASAAANPGADRSSAPIPAGGPGLAASAFASLRGVASGTGPVLGGGASLGLSVWRGVFRPTFWLSGSYNAPFGEQTTDVAVETTVTSFRGGASVGLVALRGFGLDVGLGAGADLFHTVPGNPSPNVTLGPTMDLVDPVVASRAEVSIGVAAVARLVLGVDVDYDLASHRYVTALAGGPSSVFEPWPVRPSVRFGLCVPLVGGAGCGE